MLFSKAHARATSGTQRGRPKPPTRGGSFDGSCETSLQIVLSEYCRNRESSLAVQRLSSVTAESVSSMRGLLLDAGWRQNGSPAGPIPQRLLEPPIAFEKGRQHCGNKIGHRLFDAIDFSISQDICREPVIEFRHDDNGELDRRAIRKPRELESRHQMVPPSHGLSTKSLCTTTRSGQPGLTFSVGWTSRLFATSWSPARAPFCCADSRMARTKSLSLLPQDRKSVV